MKTKKNPKSYAFALLIGALFAFCMAGCSDSENQVPFEGNEETQDESKQFCSESISVIPLEDAMSSLEQFLSEVEGDFCATRAGSTRKIESVDVHYSDLYATRSGESLPDAYIVNFEDDEGFAVLGANTAVASIVAVTEKGHIDPVTLSVQEGQEDNSDMSNFNWYCEEDDDYYVDDDGNYSERERHSYGSVFISADFVANLRLMGGEELTGTAVRLPSKIHTSKRGRKYENKRFQAILVQLA